jgi:hypothetical protein
VCPNCNQQLDTTGYKKIRVKEKEETENYCIDCGEKISRGAKRCKKCNSIKQKEGVRPAPVSREELKKLIRTFSLAEVDRRLDASRNQRIRWCKEYNLPDTKTLIDSYSDEEWEEI